MNIQNYPENNLSLESLMALETLNSSEGKKASQNMAQYQWQKQIEAAQGEIQEMRKQNKNTWWSAIFDTMVNVFSSVANLIPGCGKIVSESLGFLRALNPFSIKIEKSKIAAKEFQLEEALAEKQTKMAESQIKMFETHQKQQNQRIERAIHNLEEGKSATTRV